GLHSVKVAAAPRRGGARRARSGRESRGRRAGRAEVARLHGVELLRRRPTALASGPGHRIAARYGQARRHRRGRGERRALHAGPCGQRGRRRPIIPPVPGLRELDGVWTNREATGMKVVPQRLLILGGGPVGVEMAQVVRRLGGEAVVVEGAERLLPREAAPLGEGLGEALRRDGIELILGTHATAARKEGNEYVLQFDGGTEVRGDRLLVATGRRPRVEGIGLETVGVEANPHGIPVDDRLRAGERLFAIGDVNGIWPLTHVGEYEGDVVAENIAGDGRPANYEAVPRVSYTDPQAAAVGALEAEYSATAL